ncbi:zf-HC2 domain-containing protein [Paenibacillus sp. HN-1]|uniref:zf-HC2 domain-containing protein n=1 Tax=Paenibacillus TaxID=44249 RepID=UPI001CA95B1E|nr:MULTISPECIES: zf-HC2 domain-containing protein [Paenibacillus]MBY9079489.1 zf-HC2 domain-containing protein [Paenibacillus sp. CGMCC 1.18879]MBY9085578.1 zf-HC2 domain-containing protein [Paenibacillus sinensis]
MNCAEVIEWMNRYLDHDLSRDEALEMFRHIDDCPSCAEMFERLSALSSELESLPDVSPPFSLVDSILPKLDEIDRTTAEEVISPAQEPKIQEMSRRASRKPRSSSLSARFGIGAAAAALLLGIAVLNMPKQMPDAQVEDMMKGEASSAQRYDYDGNGIASNSVAGNSNSALPAGSAELQQSFGESVQETSPAEAYSLTSPVSPAAEDSSDQAPTPKAQPSAKADRKGSGDAAGGTSAEARKSVVSKKTAPTSPAKTPEASQEAGTMTSDAAEDRVSEKNAAGEQLHSSEEPGLSADMGIMAIAPSQVQDSNAWTSPDGRYSAVLEGQNLIIYRLNGGDAGSRQAISTIPFQGAWVSGQWSDDGKQFDFVTNTDGNEKRSSYILSEETPVPTGSGTASPEQTASPSPSASTK